MVGKRMAFSLHNTLPEIVFNVGEYNPEELNINLPGINKIYVGMCGGVGRHRLTTFLGALAHTHKCPDDPIYTPIFKKP
jgi:hypothetical protein